MTEHPLKTWCPQYDEIVAGTKTFELRKNDRGFKRGDVLVLQEWDADTKAYTGRECRAKVMYLTDGKIFGALQEGWVCMSLKVERPDPPLLTSGP